STVKPPKYPLPVDSSLAATGASVFQTECAKCHAPGGERTGKLIPVAEIGTDPHRVRMWTAASAAAYNAKTSSYSWKFSNFRSTDGYSSVLLDGLWMRAPYLHNGSVPTLDDLLKPAASRPTMFWRGYDLFDPVGVGFVTTGEAARRVGTPF